MKGFVHGVYGLDEMTLHRGALLIPNDPRPDISRESIGFPLLSKSIAQHN
jgi:hypothetical protein